MTFNPAEYRFWYKEYPQFTQWAMQKDILFLPKEIAETDDEKQYDLTSRAYILMKRLGQDYNSIMLMDAEERDRLFDMEMQLIKEEAKKNKNE